MWDLFKDQRESWVRPRPGQCQVAAAWFKVEGRPVKVRVRPMTPVPREELDVQLAKMLKHGVIRPSKSPWGSPPVFVRKKNGKWRMALDYRRVNAQLSKDAYPIPLLWETIQTAAHHIWYTALDIRWGFWCVPLEEGSKAVTAIVSHRGTFEFNVLPFGICNSPSEFQRAIDQLFGHLDTIAAVLKVAKDGGVFLALEKGQYGCHEVERLGHKVGLKGISP
eukprot:GHVN01030668.1.p1 GENE.GHVN01030668.1~~GHVN01030668.1.p1  ORF type:complete len:221 (+),score=18.86 GHVN01030668.1:1386-2048(+)